MKNYIKYLLVFSLLLIFSPLISNAATLTLNGTPSGNKVEYTVKYTKGESDTDSTISFDISNSDTSITPAVTELSTSSTCNTSKCTVTLPEGDSVGVPIDVAKIVLENTTDKEIKTTLKLTMNGEVADSKENITLSAGVIDTPKSSNSNITQFSTSVGSLDRTFDPNVTDYVITGIKDTVNAVTLNPTCENCTYTVTCPTGDCSISNKNKVMLQNGANQVAINVVSEDGTNNKIYTFNIYRGDVVTSSAYLENLKIKNAKLSPTFNPMTNDYSVIVDLDVDKLDITTITEDPSAQVEIKGNEKLVEGENTITITVTSSDSENKQVYTITVTKEKQDKNTKKKVTTTKVKKKKNNILLIVILSIIGALLIAAVFFIIFKKKKKNKKDSNNKNDNNSDGGSKNILEENRSIINENDLIEPDELGLKDEENELIKQNTESLNILEETRRQLNSEPKLDIDDALDDLMKTKKIELEDLDL